MIINWLAEKIKKKIIIDVTWHHSEPIIDLGKKINNYRKENQSLSGRIKILEEQQEIMHGFLVEINKYLAKNK